MPSFHKLLLAKVGPALPICGNSRCGRRLAVKLSASRRLNAIYVQLRLSNGRCPPMREVVMRLVARLTMCFMPILTNAAQTDAQAPSDP
jgi:hypothetical protein